MIRDPVALRPGAVRVFRPGHSLALGVGVWAKRNQSGRIHIHITGGKAFHTTVTNHRESKRYHRTLFRNLRRLLDEQGAWPYGNDGVETEERTD